MDASPRQPPAIKGSLFGPVRDDVQALLAREALSRYALEARLDAGDLAFLEEKIAAALWYPIDTYARLLDTLRDVEGGVRPDDYLRERGATAAQRLIEGGLYSQMDASIDTWGERVGNIMVTLAPLIFNFGTWTCDTSKGALRVDATGVAALPDSARIVIEGFIQVMAKRALRAEVSVVSRRPAPGRIQYQGARP